MTLQLGPLALPLGPVLLLGMLLLAGTVVRLVSPRELRSRADTALWTATLIGLFVARLSHLILHLEAYREQPLSWLDIRDGGFIAWPGVLAGLASLAWLIRGLGRTRWRIFVCAGAATALWGLTSFSLMNRTLQGTPALADLPVLLQSLSDPAQTRTLQQIAQHDGTRPMVVNLWATWCPPCRAEMPVFAKMQRERSDVRFVFVNQGESREVIQAYLDREALSLKEMWLDAASGLGPAMGSSGLPTTLLFDARGKLIKIHLGVLNEGALRVMLARVREQH